MLNRPNVEFANFYIFCSSNGPTPICKIFQKVNDKQKSYTRFSKTPSYPLTLESVSLHRLPVSKLEKIES